MARAAREGAFRTGLVTARALSLGTLHGSEEEALGRLEELARRAGLATAPGLRIADGTYLVSGRDCTLQLDRCDSNEPEGTGPFTTLQRWRYLLVVTDPRSGDAHALGTALAPFSESELEVIAGLNPLVARLAERHAETRPLAGVDLVMRDHLLLEKYNLLRGLRRCGLNPARCWVVRKMDATRYGDRVAAQLNADGFRVVAANKRLDMLARLMVGAGGNLIVLDDGGDLSLAISRCATHDVHLLESTSKGVRTLVDAGLEGRFADIASSTVKLQLSRVIAVSCVMRFRELLQHERVAGESCHLVGYGRLGRHVAALLSQMGTLVTVSELRAEAREDAINDGFDVFSSAREALAATPHRYLIGCSGMPVVGRRELNLMVPGAILASVSSQDLRPALTWLRVRTEAHRCHGTGTRYLLPDGRSWTVLADGHAINLFRAEGVSELDYDPFTALLLSAVLETARVGVSRLDLERLCTDIMNIGADQRPGAVMGV